MWTTSQLHEQNNDVGQNSCCCIRIKEWSTKVFDMCFASNSKLRYRKNGSASGVVWCASGSG